MTWFSKFGRAEDTTDQEPNLSQKPCNERPGKFSDLSEFMTIEKGHTSKYVPGTQASVNTGHIIYINDLSGKDTRINDRVMLVLFDNYPFSFTCLSFCCHSDFGSQLDLSGESLFNSHALVCTDQGQQTNLSLPRLEINLRHDATPVSLQPHIYLNLREHWNIEREVEVVILGRVVKDSYKRLVPEIERLFSQSLMGADFIRDSGNPPASHRPESAEPERKRTHRREKNSEATGGRRKSSTLYRKGDERGVS
jgi:hypothetical protein